MMVQVRNHVEHLDHSPAGRPLTCEEFQARMPELLGEDIRDHEHLKTCDRCAALLDELEYIAGMAGELLGDTHDPGDSVWKKIRSSLPEAQFEAVKTNGHLQELPIKG